MKLCAMYLQAFSLGEEKSCSQPRFLGAESGTGTIATDAMQDSEAMQLVLGKAYATSVLANIST